MVTGTVMAAALSIFFPPLPFLAAAIVLLNLTVSFALRGRRFFAGDMKIELRLESEKDRPYPLEGDIFHFAERPRFTFDVNGVIMYKPAPGGDYVYNPAYVGYQALLSYNRHVTTRNENYMIIFEKCCAWISENAKSSSKTACWPYGFDYDEGGRRIAAPWNSCIASGFCISALLRRHWLNGNPDDLKLAMAAGENFFIGQAEGGFLYEDEKTDFAFLEEYPLVPPVHIFDGFAFALIALRELGIATGKDIYSNLCEKLTASLERNFSIFDAGGIWSSYGTHGILSTGAYHRINTALLYVIGGAYKKNFFIQKHSAWSRYEKSAAIRYMIYLNYHIRYYIFLIAKNWKRNE